MTRRLMLLLAAVLLLAADTPKEDAAKADLAKLQGEWVMVSLERDGQKAPEESLKTFRRKIEGNKYTVTITKGGEVEKVEGTFTLDPTKKPKATDVKPANAEVKDQVVQGIYELDGDTHKICMPQPGGPRPTEFTAPERSGRTLIVWKRVKP